MDSERVLPHDMKLDTYLRESGNAMRLDLKRLRARQADILDVGVEFDTLREPQSFMRMAELLEREYIQTGMQDSEIVLYRSIAFSYQVAKRLHGDDIDVSPEPYLQQISKRANAFETLLGEVSSYLNDNEDIRQLLYDYGDELTQGRDRHAYVLLGGGLTFLLAERSHAERFIGGDIAFPEQPGPEDLD